MQGAKEMMRILFYVAIVIVVLHGLIHLLGFVAYWPLGEIAELPYKTTLLDGRFHLGQTGMRLFSVFWLLAAVGLVGSAISLVADRSWWLPLMLAAVLVSLVITVLDSSNAFRGALLSLVMLVPLLLVWGLRLQPQPFAAIPQSRQPLTAVALSPDLPAPVARYYQAMMGNEVPVVETAVITGRGTLRFMGITFPARLRFTHEAGQGYRHYIEATLFGYPVLKVNERYLDGIGKMELPVGVIENEPKVNMAANLGLWGESIWLPSIYITDSRVRWEAINETSALLFVPYETVEESFTVYFNPETGLIKRMEAMRYKDATSEEKTLWQLDIQDWDTYQGNLLPSRATVTWADEGSPWLIIKVEDIVFNVDVNNYIRAKGS
jgi:hypothetical protein